MNSGKHWKNRLNDDKRATAKYSTLQTVIATLTWLLPLADGIEFPTAEHRLPVPSSEIKGDLNLEE